LEKTQQQMSQQNLQEEIVRITKTLSLEDASDIFYKIILQKKLQRAEDDIKNGRVYTAEQAKDKLKRWFN
jgi:hypothetical protein